MPTRVQGGATGANASNSTIALTLSAVGSGNCIIGIVGWGDDTHTVSVTDDKSNVYTVNVTNDTGSSQGCAVFVLGNITNAPSTITATFNITSNFTELAWTEYSGVAALTDPRDGHASLLQDGLASTATDAITSGSITPTTDGCLIWAATMDDGGVIPAAGTGFTSRESDNQGGTGVAIKTEDFVQTTAAAVAGTFTQSTQPNPWVTFVAALKASSAALTLNAQQLVMM